MTSEFLAHKWLTGLLAEPLWLGLTSQGQELSGNGYARVQVNGMFRQPSNRSVVNNRPIVFVKASGDWPPVDGASTWDAPSGGNELLPGTLAQEQPQEIQAGVRAIFDPGEIELAVA